MRNGKARHLGDEQSGAVACQLCGSEPSQQSLFNGTRDDRHQLHGQRRCFVAKKEAIDSPAAAAAVAPDITLISRQCGWQ